MQITIQRFNEELSVYINGRMMQMTEAEGTALAQELNAWFARQYRRSHATLKTEKMEKT